MQLANTLSSRTQSGRIILFLLIDLKIIGGLISLKVKVVINRDRWSEYCIL